MQNQALRRRHAVCWAPRSRVNVDDANKLRDGRGDSLSQELLEYLVQHPEALDTREGIAEWWLLKQRISEVVGNLEAVLDDLVKQGFLLANRGEEGRIYYCLNRAREREVRKYLRNSKTSEPVIEVGRQLPDE